MRKAVYVLSGLALGAWLWAGRTFEVGGGLQGPLVHEAGPMYWERGCWGATYEEVAIDAGWTRCLGVPYGPRRCYGYPRIPDSLDRTDVELPLGPLREIPCPPSRRP